MGSTPVPAEPRPAAQRWRLWRPRLRDLLPMALMLVIIACAAGVVIRREHAFSQIDEFQHFNYITELVYNHRIPVPGDTFTQQAMRAHACHLSTHEPRQPPCDSVSFDPLSFETGGQATTGGYPPAYYVPTAGVAWVVSKAIGAKDLFVPARLASVLWLLLGAALTYLLARSLAVGRWVAAGLTLLAALSPIMLYQGATVNPDAMSLLAGSGTAVAWLALRAVPRWWSVAALGAVLTFVAWIKPNFVAVPIAVALAEVALAARPGPRALINRATWSVRGPATRVCAAAAAAVALGLAWPLYFRVVLASAAARGPSNKAFGRAPWNTDIALRGLANSLRPLSGLPTMFNHGSFVLFSAVVDVLALSGVVGVAMMSRRRELPRDLVSSGPGAPPIDALRAVAYLAAASLVVAAPVTYAIVGASGAFIIYPPRYSLFLIPLGLVALAGLASGSDAAAAEPPEPSQESTASQDPTPLPASA